MSLKGRKETVVQNRKAKFEYEWIEQFEAGLSLTGTEVKSLRHGKANLQEAYCTIENEQAYVLNMNIAEYEQGSYNNHAPQRKRKLLLKKREIEKLRKGIEQQGNTIVPIRLFFNASNLAKLQIALARGKKVHDKRNSIRERDTKREMDRQMKKHN
jgi:SsrA-binding protein